MLNEEEVEAPYIEPYETFTCGGDIDGIRLTASWTSKQQGVICDLDLNAFLYDERVSSSFSITIFILYKYFRRDLWKE